MIQVGVGITDRLKFYAGVPYNWEKFTDNDGFTNASYKQNGIGSTLVGTKYQLADGCSTPVAFTLGFEANIETGSGKGGLPTNEFSPLVAVSGLYRNGRTIPYAQFGFTFRDKEKRNTFESILGIQSKLGDSFILDVLGSARLQTSGTLAWNPTLGQADGSQDYSLSVKLMYNISKHLYLTPFCGATFTSSATISDSSALSPSYHIESGTGFTGGLKLYSLF